MKQHDDTAHPTPVWARAARGDRRRRDEGARLVDRAAAWLPHVAAPVQATTLAYRVLPEDGYPAVGFTQAGSYVCAAHSAITLAPVLSALAVAELLDGVDVDVLEPWRPGRFC